MTLSLDSRPIPAPDVVGQIVQNEAVLVLPLQGEAKVLNEVGATIWRLADGSRSIRDIAAVLCEEYDVAPEEARRDTFEFVAELVRRQILLLASDEPG